MKIQINGVAENVSCDTLAELLSNLGHEPNSVATAHNGEFVPYAERERCNLADGDAIDIIAPMSGG